MDQSKQNAPTAVSDEELLEDIPFEEEYANRDEFMPKHTAIEQKFNRQYVLSNLLILLVGLPLLVAPALVLLILGRVNKADLQFKFGSGPNYHTEVARLDIFITVCAVSFWVINILTFGIPNALPGSRGKCFIQVRRYFNISFWLTGSC